MTKIKLNWAYAKGELDTDTLKLICLPARGKRLFGNSYRPLYKVPHPIHPHQKRIQGNPNK